jgi:hypothetical protein
LPLDERAALLERYSGECYLTDETDEAMEALRSAAAAYHELGDPLKEGATLGQLATILWCPGRGAEARHLGAEGRDAPRRRSARPPSWHASTTRWRSSRG